MHKRNAKLDVGSRVLYFAARICEKRDDGDKQHSADCSGIDAKTNLFQVKKAGQEIY